MRKISFTILSVFLLFACSQELEQKPTTPLYINTAENGEIRFNVEIAQTPDELQKGLMYRTEMASNNGMIFIFDPVRPVQMWMKNTKLSLDMLFVAANGKIVMIKEKTTPMSENRISCKEPVRAVVELNAGQVKRHKITVGNTVRHSAFDSFTTLSDQPVPLMGKTGGPIIPKGPNAVGGPKPFGNPNGPVIPKGPNAVGGPKPFGDPNGPVIPKGPNAVAPQPQPIVPVVPPM